MGSYKASCEGGSHRHIICTQTQAIQVCGQSTLHTQVTISLDLSTINSAGPVMDVDAGPTYLLRPDTLLLPNCIPSLHMLYSSDNKDGAGASKLPGLPTCTWLEASSCISRHEQSCIISATSYLLAAAFTINALLYLTNFK